MKRKNESEPIREARGRRAVRLSGEVMEWARLAEQRQYPRSLVEILENALKHEYTLGYQRKNREHR